MEPEAHFAIAEAEEDEHRAQTAAKERGALKMDAAWWSTFLLLLIAMSLTVTGELLLKTGMNRHGELNVELSTIIPTAVKLFTSPWVVGGFAFVFSGALFWLAVPLALAPFPRLPPPLHQLHHRHNCLRALPGREDQPCAVGGRIRDYPGSVPDQQEQLR